jgi:hypothetical protein
MLPLPRIEPQSPGLPVRNQTLYSLRYPGSRNDVHKYININTINSRQTVRRSVMLISLRLFITILSGLSSVPKI